MKRFEQKTKRREKRKLRIRGRLTGTVERPRLTVFRSNRHLYVQAIDDVGGVTIAAVSSRTNELKGLKPTKEDAVKIGEAIGKVLLEKKVSTVVFDRNGYLYHGVIQSLADGARKAGLQF